MVSGSQEKVLDLRLVLGLEANVTAPSKTTGGAYVEMDVTAQPGSETLIHDHPERRRPTGSWRERWRCSATIGSALCRRRRRLR